MQWVTREHTKADRIACPWLIRKFIDHAHGVRRRPWRSAASDQAMVITALPPIAAAVTRPITNGLRPRAAR